ncbi:MAG: beta strand repeat-containing protein [Rubripirellula sp.]
MNRASKRSNRKLKQRRLRMEQMERRELLASDLGAISGVSFIDQNGDGSNANDPPVLVDNSGDLVAPGTAGAQGIQIQLFSDTNNDDIFDGGDLLVGTDITDLNGNYRFDSLSPGTYFIQQQAVPQLTTPAAIAVEVVNDQGIQTAQIDDYSATTQSVTATAGNTNTDSANATEAIGGSRDIEVTNTAATGQVTVFIDNVSGTLSVGSLGDGVGTARIQYDGADNSLALNPAGLGGISLAGGAPGAAVDPGAGLIIETRAENAGDQLFVTIHTDGTNSSTATVNVPQDATTFTETFVLFSDFVTATGTGADFNNVGAIETSINLSANNDAFVSIVETRRPDVVAQNVANIQPLALGGQIFLDSSTAGQNDGIRQGTEAGVTGITVELYQLAGANDVVDPVNNVALTTTVTGAGGIYSFPNLDPGHYSVVIPSAQFTNGAALFGFANSTGNDPIADPDDNVDDVDDGTTLASTDVASGTITLESNTEPINDDDTDANTNTTVDFGVFPQIDLSITKTLNAAGSNVIAAGNAVFDIVVQNAGPLPATNVEVTDLIPAGLTFTGIANASGAFTTNVNGATTSIVLGTLASGSTATFQITTDIGDNQTADIVNTATVAGTEVETDDTNNSDDETLDLIEADLRIEKTDVQDPVNAGDQLTYQITVTNDGPDDASGVVVVDPLPAGVTFVSGDVGGAANLVQFDAVSGEVTATVGNLANGANSVITVNVTVATDSTSPLTNTATVTSDPNTDPDPTNNSTDEDTTVNREVDVAIQKTVTGTPVAGQDVTYTLVVTNNGPSQARDVSVSDVLETDLTFVAGSFDPLTSGVTLAQNGQTLTFDVGILDAAETATFTFDATIASSATGTIPNDATVTTTDTDTVAANNTDSAPIVVQQQIDLILQKDVDLATATPGQDSLVYTFTISHDTDSPSDATNVVLTDVLPAGLTGTVISAPTADSSDFSNGTVTVGFNSIPVGETRTFTVSVDVDQTATTTIVNPASITADGTELDTANNSDTATTALTPDFDVVVTKSVDNATPGVGGTVIYTVGINNEGPSQVNGVVLTDVIPNDLTFVSATMGANAGVSDGTSISFPGGDLAAGASQTAALTFTVDATANGTITNTASVPDRTADGENDITNNSATADITVTPQADITVAKTVSLVDAQVGSDLVYTITGSNNGPSAATSVTATDTLPAGVNFVSGTGPNGEALTATGGVITVDGGTVQSTGSFSFTINATIAAGATGTLTNNVTVATPTSETNTANNAASATTTIDPGTSSIAGTVYVDANNNGIQDAGEDPIPGVELTLTGTDTLGNAVTRAATTNASGDYLFASLAAGTYTVTETQPSGFRDGIETAGTGANASTADNVFTQLGLGAATDAIEFNFGELNEALSKRRFLASTPG